MTDFPNMHSMWSDGMAGTGELDGALCMVREGAYLRAGTERMLQVGV